MAVDKEPNRGPKDIIVIHRFRGHRVTSTPCSTGEKTGGFKTMTEKHTSGNFYIDDGRPRDGRFHKRPLLREEGGKQNDEELP